MQKCIPKVFGLGGEGWVGDLCLQILGCAKFASKNITLQYSRVPQLPSTQSNTSRTTFSCSRTDIAVLHPEDGIVHVQPGTRL